jgi:hypothetical protein
MAKLMISERVLNKLLGLDLKVVGADYDAGSKLIGIEFRDADFGEETVTATVYFHNCDGHQWYRTSLRVPGFVKELP